MFFITENSESESLKTLIKNEIEFLIKHEINNFNFKSITIIINNEDEKEISNKKLEIINNYGQDLLSETFNEIEENKLEIQEILGDYFNNLI